MARMPPVGAARLALTAVFFAVGIATGAWAACIPGLKRTLALSEARLGVALLAVAGGALVAMPLAGWLAARVGSRRATALAALAGLATGGVDASMNAHAAERAWGAPIMSSFHTFFSLGGLAGAAAAGLALGPADPRAAAAGLALVGLGLSNVVPVLFTAAARAGGAAPAVGVAMAATVGYTGLLAGPPLIGLVANLVGLRLALAIPGVGCVVIAGCAGWVRAGPADSSAESLR